MHWWPLWALRGAGAWECEQGLQKDTEIWEFPAVWAGVWHNSELKCKQRFLCSQHSVRAKREFYTPSLTGLCFLEVLSQGGGAGLACGPVSGESPPLESVKFNWTKFDWVTWPCFNQQVEAQNVLPSLRLSTILWFIWSLSFLKDCLKWVVWIEEGKDVDGYNCNSLSSWIGSTCKNM